MFSFCISHVVARRTRTKSATVPAPAANVCVAQRGGATVSTKTFVFKKGLSELGQALRETRTLGGTTANSAS